MTAGGRPSAKSTLPLRSPCTICEGSASGRRAASRRSTPGSAARIARLRLAPGDAVGVHPDVVARVEEGRLAAGGSAFFELAVQLVGDGQDPFPARGSCAPSRKRAAVQPLALRPPSPARSGTARRRPCCRPGAPPARRAAPGCIERLAARSHPRARRSPDLPPAARARRRRRRTRRAPPAAARASGQRERERVDDARVELAAGRRAQLLERLAVGQRPRGRRGRRASRCRRRRPPRCAPRAGCPRRPGRRGSRAPSQRSWWLRTARRRPTARARSRPGPRRSRVLAQRRPLLRVQRTGLREHAVRTAILPTSCSSPPSRQRSTAPRGRSSALATRPARSATCACARSGTPSRMLTERPASLPGARPAAAPPRDPCGQLARAHAVAPAALGRVERAVGGVEQAVHGRAAGRARRAHRGRLRSAPPAGERRPPTAARTRSAARAAPRRCGCAAAGRRTPRRPSAPPCRSARPLADAARALAQRLVAGQVPEAVVDLLEVVEVDDQQARRLALAAGARQLGREHVAEVAAVGELGQHVDAAQPLGLGAGALRLAQRGLGQRQGLAQAAPPSPCGR